jgi:hypothetical protein
VEQAYPHMYTNCIIQWPSLNRFINQLMSQLDVLLTGSPQQQLPWYRPRCCVLLFRRQGWYEEAAGVQGQQEAAGQHRTTCSTHSQRYGAHQRVFMTDWLLQQMQVYMKNE